MVSSAASEHGRLQLGAKRDVVVTLMVNGLATSATCSFNTATDDTCTSAAAVAVTAGSEIAVEVSFTETPVAFGKFLFAVEAG